MLLCGLRAPTVDALPCRHTEGGGGADADRCRHCASLEHSRLQPANRGDCPIGASRRGRIGRIHRADCIRMCQRRPDLPIVDLEQVVRPMRDARQHLAVETVTDLCAQPEVAFPLRLVEELVGSRLLREQRIRRFEVDQVDRQLGRHVGLDQHHVAAQAALIVDARQRQARLAVGRSQVVERAEHADVGPVGIDARLQQNDVGAEIDARPADKVLEIVEAVVGVGAAIGYDDEFGLLPQQRIHAGVLEMSAIAQVPVGRAAARKCAEALEQHEARLHQEGRRMPRRTNLQDAGLRAVPPVAQPQSREHRQRCDPSLGHAAESGCERRAGYGRPGTHSERRIAMRLGPGRTDGLHPAQRADGQRKALAIAVE